MYAIRSYYALVILHGFINDNAETKPHFSYQWNGNLQIMKAKRRRFCHQYTVVTAVNGVITSYSIHYTKLYEDDQSIQTYCKKQGIEVLMEIPYMREIAKNYSEGVLPVFADQKWKARFGQLYDSIKSYNFV